MNCIFHSERTPSLDIYLEKGFYRCWGCHKTGRMIDIAAYVPEIYDYISKLPEEEWRKKRKVLDINEKKSGNNEDFLKKYLWEQRKIFKLCGPAYIEKNYIVFPYEGGKHKRKLYSKEFLQEGEKNFYPDGIEKEKKVILVEGPFDALYLRQFGYPAYACLGKSIIKPERLKNKHIILFFDPDVTEEHVAKEVRKVLFFSKVDIIRAQKDPDQYTFKEIRILLKFSEQN